MQKRVTVGNTRRFAVPGLWLLLCATLSSSVAVAATISVSGTTDEDTNNSYCSLREAIQSAVNDSCYNGCSCGVGDDTICLPAGTYNLAPVAYPPCMTRRRPPRPRSARPASHFELHL